MADIPERVIIALAILLGVFATAWFTADRLVPPTAQERSQ